MKAADFARWVLPEAPYYCMGVLTGKSMQQLFYTSKDALVNAILAQDVGASGSHVYYAFAGFREQRRRKASISALRTYVFDVDISDTGVKNGKPAYRSQSEAIDAIRQLAEEKRLLLPTFIVSSGTGLHLYWTLQEDVDAKTWQATANALKKLIANIDPKLAADTARAADPAGFLRMPGTTNPKNGRPVEVLEVNGLYTQQMIADAVTGFAAPQAALPANAGLLGDLQVEGVEPVIVTVKSAFEACAQIRDAYMNQAREGYEGWQRLIQLCTFMERGREFAHAASKMHPGYNPAQVDKLFDDALKYREQDGIGPTSCEAFAMARGREDLCNGCPYKGKSKNPIMVARNFGSVTALPKVANDAEPERNEGEEGDVYDIDVEKELARLNQATTKGLFFLNENGLHFREHVTKSGSLSVNTVRVLPRMVKVFGKNDTSILVGLTDRSFRRITEFRVVRVADVGTTSMHHKVFEAIGYPRQADEPTAMSAFIGAISRLADTHTDEIKLTSCFGWTKNGFVIGKDLITKDGTVRAIPVGNARDMAADLSCAGKRDVAIAALRRYMELIDVNARMALLASLASPLVHLMGSNRRMAMLHLYGRSGTGKTTLFNIASSFWGRPHLLNPLSTMKARYLRYATYRHLPVIYDELTVATGHAGENAARLLDLGEFVYSMTTGQGRDTATRSGNLSSVGKGEWNNATMTAANAPTADMLSATTGQQMEAQFLRAVDLNITETTVAKENMAEAQKLYTALIDNHGHIGRMFIEVVVRHRKEIASALERAFEKLDDQYGSKYRFLTTLLVCVEMAEHILRHAFGVRASDMKITDIIRDKLKKSVDDNLEVVEEELSPAEQLDTVLSHFVPHAATFNANPSPTSVDAVDDMREEVYVHSPSVSPNCRITIHADGRMTVRVAKDYADKTAKRACGCSLPLLFKRVGVKYERMNVALNHGVPDGRGTPQIGTLAAPCYVFEVPKGGFSSLT